MVAGKAPPARATASSYPIKESPDQPHTAPTLLIEIILIMVVQWTFAPFMSPKVSRSQYQVSSRLVLTPIAHNVPLLL